MRANNQTNKEIINSLGSCPYLGMINDAETSVSFPSDWNYCHRCVPKRVPTYTHQSSYCLTKEHTTCTVYISEPGLKMPNEIVHKEKKEIVFKHKPTFLIIPILLIFVAVMVFLATQMRKNANENQDFIINQKNTEQNRVTQATIIDLPSPTATEVPKTSTPSATFVATSESTPLPTLPIPRNPHLLDSPIGKETQFIIHRVAENENLYQFATLFNTTPEAIIAVNYELWIPIWSESIIIIPMNISDVSELPAFEAYMVEEENLAIEEIAAMFSVDLDELIYYNDIKAGDELQLGEWLLIPHERINP
jgi:hypothetical protein